VISEIAAEWEAAVRRWRGWNRVARRNVEGATVPDAGEALFLYQALAGAWPLGTGADETFLRRLEAYLLKAGREAKVHTSWHAPRPAREGALRDFVAEILTPSPVNRFLPDFTRMAQRIAFHGAINSLSQVLLKIAAPGTPDFYQGCESWDLSLVDPDNRRPVDFEIRARWLDEIRAGESRGARTLSRLLETWPDGRIKLWLTWKALQARRARRDLFVQGAYIPLQPTGEARRHVVAFARRHRGAWVIAAAPRLMARRTAPGVWPLGNESWSASRLELPAPAPRRWANLLTGRRVQAGAPRGDASLALADLFEQAPVALLGSV